MKGDFSRITFDAAHHFSRVLMQQGRVTIDADANEQAAILLHYMRTLARDLIGPCGGPADMLGFTLDVKQGTTASSVPWTLTIQRGRYYVDGILCENDEHCAYDGQPDHPLSPKDPLAVELGKPTPSTTAFWLYLDVWERHITPVEDDRMREVALGGPDTCTRAKVIWQVKALPLAAPQNLADPTACTKPVEALRAIVPGTMAAELDPGQQIKDPCVIAPDARYRGAENQLYRVEIHRGNIDGDTTPTFKWSRDNGSVASAWLKTDGNDLIVANARGFSAGTWVELSDDVSDLRGDPGLLVKLISVDGNHLSVDPSSVPAEVSIPSTTSLKNPKVRRWDQTENDDITLPKGEIQIPTDNRWIDLEDGIRVQFDPAAGKFRTGDYWLIPARVATGDIEWPRTGTKAGFLPPRGIEHHYAPVGWLIWGTGESGNGWVPTSCLCTLNQITQCGPNAGLMGARPTPGSTQLKPTPAPAPPAPTPEPTPAPPPAGPRNRRPS